MSLRFLRTAVFEITKKPKHNTSDVVALQLINMQITGLFLSDPGLAATKEAVSFTQFLFKEMRRVLITAKNNTQKPDIVTDNKVSGTEE